MAAPKKVIGSVKVQCEAGKANPAPPIGPALGPYGINIMQFCKEFNEKTASQPGMIIPAVITIYADDYDAVYHHPHVLCAGPDAAAGGAAPRRPPHRGH